MPDLAGQGLWWFLGLVVLATVAGSVRAGEGPGPKPGFRLVEVAGEAGVGALNTAGELAKDYIVDSTGSGAAFLDYDGDGDLDVLLTNGSTLERLGTGGDPMLHLYRNDGGTFVDVTRESGLEAFGWGMGLCAGDFDGDGLGDFLLTALGPNYLFRGTGSGVFERTALGEEAGEAPEEWSASCAFADFDGDGALDLYVANYVDFEESEVPHRADPPGCNYLGKTVFCGPLGLTAERDRLYRNLDAPRGSFGEVPVADVTPMVRYGLALVVNDLDDDGIPDVYVANDSESNVLFLGGTDATSAMGTGGSGLVDSALLSGVAVNGRAEAQAGMGVTSGDPDNDGDLDLLVTNFSQDHNTFYRNFGSGLFQDASYPVGLAGPSLPHLAWSTGFQDFDNDGREDLFVANGHIYEDVEEFSIGSTYRQPNQVFWNRDLAAGGRFEDVTDSVFEADQNDFSSRGAAFGDFDEDGDVDVVVNNINDRPSLYRNDPVESSESVGRGTWIQLAVRGADLHHGIGVRFRVTTSPGRAVGGDRVPERQIREVQSGEGYLSQSALRAHFGLGAARKVDVVELVYRGRSVARYLDLPVGRTVVLVR